MLRDTLIYMVLGVLGQNGADKMVWTKWHTDKMSFDKMVRTKWYEYNGADKIINQSINHVPTDNMIFSSIPLPLGSLYISSVFLALFCSLFLFCFFIVHDSLNLDVVSLVIGMIVFCYYLLHTCLVGLVPFGLPFTNSITFLLICLLYTLLVFAIKWYRSSWSYFCVQRTTWDCAY